MRTRSILVALVFLAAAVPASFAADIQGEWLTDPDQALEAAAKAKKPVLAVAMDHA